MALFTPDYSHITGLVKHLNNEELKDILNNDEKAEAIIKDLKQLKDIEAERELLLASNRSISEYNLSQKPIIDECKKSLEETHKEALDLKDKLQAEKGKIESKSQSTDTLLSLLEAATSEIEEETEATVEVFLKAELSIDDFIEKYLQLRKLAHLRRIKSEKLAKLLQENGNRNFPPEKPQRLRKPPAPPTPPFHPYLNQHTNAPGQNIPIAPVRQAPQPPHFQPTPFAMNNIPNQNYPAGYGMGSYSYRGPYPYPTPQSYPGLYGK